MTKNLNSKSRVQPMPSTRIADGMYEVIGTSRSCILKRERAYRALGGGNLWQLVVDGEPLRKFETKRDALEYCQCHPEL